MKRIILFGATLALTMTAFSQNKNQSTISKNEKVPVDLLPVTFHGTVGPLSTYQEDPNALNEITRTEKLGYHPKDDWVLNEKINPNALPVGADPALQKEYNTNINTHKAMVIQFDGMGYTGVNPADPAVDVGPNHVVQMINGGSGAYIEIYDKTNGNVVMSQVYFDNFMSMPGGAGDPIVLYDERAQVWYLSEFSNSGNNMHLAVSSGSNPVTSTWNTYSFNAPSFPDYPKWSIWEDALIITTNENNSRVYAINRADLLAGTPTTAQSFNMTNFPTIGFQAATPVSLLGTTTPPAGTPPMVMRMRDDAWSASIPADALEIWTVNIDWATPGNSGLTQIAVLNMNFPFDSELCGYTSFSCIDQPSSGTNLDPLREVLMNRIMYRNFGTHESIVCTHVTDVSGSDQAGIKWYELRRTGGTSGSWSIYQESTYSPDGDSRWMPSIGLSASGNIGLAYNVSGASTFPSLRYTGRKECDPLNTMTEVETSLAVGSSPNGSNRYGDYNAMGVDPIDGETFWFTGMYNTASQWSTRIGAFDIDQCAPNVSFQSSTYSPNEADDNVNNNCLDYHILNVPISIGSEPSQPANVTVSVTGGTATQGQDYDINNTSFTFSGTTLSGNVEIWVYNDNYVEGNETIDLGYTLNANGGNATAGTLNQTVTITINDDDLAPGAMIATQTVLFDDFDDGTLAPFTTVNPSGDTPWQVDVVANATAQYYTIPTSNSTPFAYINDDDCDCDQNDVDLIFPSVDLSSYTTASLSFDSYFEQGSYQNNDESAEIYVSIGGAPATLVTTVNAAQVDVDWISQTVDLTPYTGNSNVQLSIKYSDGTGWLYGCSIDNVLIEGVSPIGIQTAVNTSSGMEANLGPNETVHFYDPATQNVMMTLENTSNHDYGCVTVEVDRDGSTPTALAFATNNTPDYLHSKTYTVTPTNNNPSGTYNVTLYYEEAEVAAWEGITGNSRNNAEIIKVAGNNRIDDVNVGNYGTFSIDNNNATVGSFNTDVTFTASFNSGFSGFGVGIFNTPTGTGPNAFFNSNTQTICENGTINFTDMSTGSPTSWSWNFGDGNTSTMQNPSNTYIAPGTYTVTLTVSDGSSNDTYTATNYITVNAASSFSQSLDLCPGSSVQVGTSTYNSAGTFTDVLTNAVGCDSTVTTTITMLNTSTSSQNLTICDGQSVTVGTSTYTVAGTYTDVVQNSVGCDSTITTTLAVNQLPTVAIDPAVPDTVCSDFDMIALNGTPSGGTFSGTGVTGSSFSPGTAGAGSHAITYSFTDGNGCSNTDVLNIVVELCDGIGENELDGVSLFPNPNDGTFIISGLESGTLYQIFDNQGKLVLQKSAESDQIQVALPHVETGIYVLRATKNGKMGSISFVVNKP